MYRNKQIWSNKHIQPESFETNIFLMELMVYFVRIHVLIIVTKLLKSKTCKSGKNLDCIQIYLQWKPS